MARDTKMSMSVGGVKKITLYQKMKTTEGEIWAEHPNLPATFLDVYLKRGFVKNPPEPKKAESKTPEKSDVTITESPKIGDRRI